MRSRAKQCAGALLMIAVPLFPVVSGPTGSLAHPSAQVPFLNTVRAEAQSARAFDLVSWMPVRRPVDPAPLEAVGGGLAPSTAVTSAFSQNPLYENSSPTIITVTEGQNLWQIANAHGVSMEAIVETNRLRTADFIRAGQHLVIPQTTGDTAASRRNLPADAVASPPAKRSVSDRHVVAEGESLWSIAQHYRVSLSSLASGNGLSEEALIHPGLKLQIPDSKASIPATRSAAKDAKPTTPTVSTAIVVGPGQNLGQIARRHGVSVSAIVEANRLRSAEFIRAGQRLVIPGVAASLPRHQTPPASVPPPPAQRVAAGFLWPARGFMTSGFGWRRSHHHNGIDIAANRGSPIMAAMAGTVIFAGWYYGYGLAVIIDHGGGLTTIYGHASSIMVHPGDEVEAGQMVARVGCTGTCSGPHLHFEVRVDGQPSNPLLYLP